jgi:hypothetical protein
LLFAINSGLLKGWAAGFPDSAPRGRNQHGGDLGGLCGSTLRRDLSR